MICPRMKKTCSRLSVIFLTTGSLMLGGCVSVSEMTLYEQYLNPKLRLDLQALTDTQRLEPAERLDYGPYRVDSDQIISTLYPNSMSRRLTANLPQSNCLWLGDAGAHGGDWVDLSWETIAVYAEPENPDAAYVHPEGGRTGLCDLADPISRTQVYSWSEDDFEPVEVLVNGQPVTIYRTSDENLGVAILVEHGRDPEETLYLSEPLQVVGGHFKQMTRPQAAYQRNRPQSHGRCDPQDFDSPSLNLMVTHNIADPNLSLFTCPSSGYDISSCGMRCTYKPVEDIRLINNSSGDRADPQHDWASPALLRVTSAGRTIARPMTRVDDSGLYRWQVGVSTAPGDASLERWDENFTPHIKIKHASVFHIDDQGNPVTAIQPNGSGLSASDTGQTLLQCHSDSSGRFPVGDPTLEPHPCGTVRAINPAYDVESLSDVAGNPLQAPLSWEIQLPELAGDAFTDTPVYIEFELEPIIAPAALSFDNGASEFDAVAPGGKSQQILRLINVGWQPVLVDRVTISENHQGGDYVSEPSAFSHRLPYQAQWLPLNVGISQTTLKSGPGIRLETLQTIDQPSAPSLASAVAPFLEMVEADGLPTLLKPAVLDGLSLNRFGEKITFDGAMGFYRDATINFAEQARSRLQDPNAQFVFGRTLYRDRDLPFVLAPGESQQILLSFAPSGSGHKIARLEVAGKVIGSGETLQISAPLLGTALINAVPETLPPSVRLPGHRPNPSTGEERTTLDQPLLLINNGDSDLTWSQASIQGSHRLYFRLEPLPGTSQRIPPGASTAFSVVFEPPRCDAPVLMAPQETQLVFLTNVGEVRVPLRADLSVCVP